jgi:16S rRNA C967 or C1407 C5-methylase (RsmB/RsmF family)/NOL1/NOP2/fmu family ribosome biogenesis protein
MYGNLFPEEFIRRIAGQEYIDTDALLNALQASSPVSIRINPVKWNRQPANAEPVPWSTNGFYLSSRPSFTLDPLFHAGCYYPQEASGMFLEEVFLQSAGSLKNIRVLDLCGAPGGKSILLSDIIGPGSLLVANEVIRSRASTLAETVTKWGLSNTLVTQSDPSVFGRLPGFFDVILVDAPCSGEGMFRTGIAVAEWSSANTALCAERQKRILTDIWPGLKENGILIYSTCTFNPGENEENIKWLISRNEAESIRLDLKSFKGINEVDYNGIFGYGFYPDKVRGEGFFISAIRKTGRQEQIIPKVSRQQELKPGKTDLKVVAEWTCFKEDRILKWGDETIALPCEMEDYIFLFRNLRIVKAGTRISVTKKNDNIPSHDLSLSVGLRKEAFPSVEINLDEAISYLRRDNINVADITAGWNILTFNGINLGFIKNLGTRINNYFPVEWRIRLDASAVRLANPIRWSY